MTRKLLLCRQGEEPTCDIHIRNRGILPAGVIRLQIRYTVEDRSRRLQVHVLGGTDLQVLPQCPSARGQDALRTVFRTGGKNVRYDYLTLFRRKKETEGTLQIAVLPKERLLTLQEMTSRGQEMPRTDRDSAMSRAQIWMRSGSSENIRRENLPFHPLEAERPSGSALRERVLPGGEETVSLTLFFRRGFRRDPGRRRILFYETFMRCFSESWKRDSEWMLPFI